MNISLFIQPHYIMQQPYVCTLIRETERGRAGTVQPAPSSLAHSSSFLSLFLCWQQQQTHGPLLLLLLLFLFPNTFG